MRIVIREPYPAWGKTYRVMAGVEQYRVDTHAEGHSHHIRVYDRAEWEVGHVFQNRTGVSAACRGKPFLDVERRLTLFHRLRPVICSGPFQGFSLTGGDIRERRYDLRFGGQTICVHPNHLGICVEYHGFSGEQTLEVLLLVLAIEAIAQYT